MVRKDRNRNRAVRRRKEKVKQNMSTNGTLNIVYWNCNGIMQFDKLEQIANLINDLHVDICLIDETHLRLGNNEDLSMLDPHWVYSKDRSVLEKKGGGKLMIIRNGVNHMQWEPGLVLNPYLNAERAWILTHENNAKIAICSVYMAAEVPNNEFRVWNEDLYAMIKVEMETIQHEGYEVILIGDFNGHVGSDEDGVPGNRGDINSNGHRLRSFVSNNNLTLLNADKSLCFGTFTRSTSNSVTVLDYALADAGARNRVNCMIIDEMNAMLSHSDHSSILLELDIGPKPANERAIGTQSLPGLNNKNAAQFRAELDLILGEQDWGVLSTEDKCRLLQSSLVEAAKRVSATGSARGNCRSFSPRWIRRLQSKSRCIEARLRQLTQEKLLYGFGLDPEGVSKHRLLQELTEAATAVRISYSEASSNLRQSRIRKQHQLNSTLTPKQFWKLVRKVDRKSGGLVAVKDLEGVLHTDAMKIEEIVLEELAKIFSGQKSKVFASKNDQLIREMQVKEAGGWEEWITKLKPDREYKSTVCGKIDVPQLEVILKGLKDDRAPGVDGVTTRMLKYASDEYKSRLTDLLNSILTEGEVPQALLVGKMTLIDKKEPSLLVSKKRPLCVTSTLLSVLTKIVHSRMDKVCEQQGFYGSAQYGFRKGRSTTECVFMLLAAIRKAKKKNHSLSVAFCDIAKAYDSVNRELLYAKLDAVGFGGRVKQLIQSMYFNDSVKVRIGEGLSRPLWFTKGVKQGCVLSPLLFALYISSLGVSLHGMREGVNFEGEVISALFFADDLVLISRTKRRGMERMLKAVQRFCVAMHMKLSVEKTIILTSGPQDTTWKVSNNEPELEAVISAKYLGINIQVKGRNLIREREVVMISTARKYAHTIMGYSRIGQDKSKIAYLLWERCALPAILYGIETMTLTKSTIRDLDKIQNLVARFILQLPKSSSLVAGYCDGGMKPIGIRIQERSSLFAWKSMNSSDRLLKTVFNAVRKDHNDSWNLALVKTMGEVGNSAFEGRKAQLKKALHNHAVATVLAMKQEHTSLSSMPQPKVWFTLASYVNDSPNVGALNRCRAGDSGLGNRRPNELGFSSKVCPLCQRIGKMEKLNEAHVILKCHALNYDRDSLGVSLFTNHSLTSYSRQLKDYLGGDNAPDATIHKRASVVATLMDKWLLRTITL